MPTQLRQQKFPFGSLRRDPHWSTKGLVFYSQFRPAGKLIDESPYGNDGTITGATWQGNGLEFSSNTDYVSLGTGFEIQSPCTIVWIGLTTTVASEDEQTWYGKRNGNDAGIVVGIESTTDSNYSRFYYYGNGSFQLWRTTVQPLTANKIHHQAWVYDGASNPVLYVDGIPYATTYDIGGGYPAVPTYAVDARFGNIVSPVDEELEGTIYDFKIYNRALSVSEIAALTINPDLPMAQDISWMGKAPAVVGANPKGPLTHPLYGPFAGPIAC